MTYELTEEQKKRLRKFLNNCDYARFEDEVACCTCRGCDEEAFTTPQDQHDLFKKLAEVGKWKSFILFSLGQESPLGITIIANNAIEVISHFIEWLFIDPARFCWLVAEFLEGEK